MSRKTLEKIIGRAAMDAKFRRKIIKDPEAAFKEYDLTEEQILAIKSIPADALEKFASQLVKGMEKDQSKA